MRNNKKRLPIFLLILVLTYLGINYRSVHAMGAATFSNTCDSELLIDAEIAVKILYGEVKSNPIVRCMHKPVLGKNISHGQANFAPGLPSVLLLGPQGQEKNVAAHEWAHAEFAYRLGVIKRTYTFPTWFDEGLAMQVDFRTPYNSEALARYLSQDGMQKPNLDDISDARFFIPGDQGKLHYAYSRCIMKKWIEQNPDWLLKIESTSMLTKFPTEEFSKLSC